MTEIVTSRQVEKIIQVPYSVITEHKKKKPFRHTERWTTTEHYTRSEKRMVPEEVRDKLEIRTYFDIIDCIAQALRKYE